MTKPGAIFSPDSPEFAQAQGAQAQAADPARSAWVEANAGSGKTKVLIDRVARLLLRRPDGRPGAHPDSILCVTYTKAAANEMLSRLFSRLGDWSIADDEALRGKLAMLEGRDPRSYDRDALKQARSLFARALETPGGLRIETIHAFCARILRRFPLEAGVSPGFTEIEDREADQLWQAVLDAGVEAAATGAPEALLVLSRTAGGLGVKAALNLLKFKRGEMSAFARRLAAAPDADMAALVKAALDAPEASSGAIIEAAMSRDFPRAQVIAACEELRAASRKATDDKLLDGLSAMLEASDPQTQYSAYLDALAGRKHDWPPKSNPFTAALPASGQVVDLFWRKQGESEGSEITRMKAVQAQLAAAQAAERSLALLTLGLPIVADYHREKALRAALDFDDLIERTRQLLTRSGAAEWILYKLDGGLTHLLLDEAQDTSPPQWALINALVEEFQSGLGRDRINEPRTQFVVGDPKQSIYSFQGADQQHFLAESEAFLRREEPIAEAEGRAVNRPEMLMSFRSSPEILTFVDDVRARVPLTDAATDPLPPPDADLKRHQVRRANQPGQVELWPLHMPDPAVTPDTSWTPPVDHVRQDAPRRRLAADIARHIRQMIDDGETVWIEQPDRSWQRRAIQPQDILILVRSRNDLFEALIESLKQQSLPVAGADRLKLLNHIGVQDCLNLIRFALQPGDDLTLAEILRGPFCGLTDDDQHLFQLAHDRKRGVTLWQRLEAATDPCFAAARQACLQLLAAKHLPPFDFLTLHLTASDGEGLTGWDRLVQRLGEPVRDPVRALVSRALGFDMREAASLQAFLAEIEADNVELKRELGQPDGAIRIMTVHGAKGLQSPIVFLPDTVGATKSTDDPIFLGRDATPLYAPSKQFDCPVTAELRALKNIANERESRRLLYVALTRASDRLIIAGAGLGNSKTGYAKTSWYRWCLTAMLALTGDPPAPDDALQVLEGKLTFGAPAPRMEAFQIAANAPIEAPAWLGRPAGDPAPPMRLAAPSRLLEDNAPVAAPFGRARSKALRRGTLIHALLQSLPGLQADARVEAAKRFLARDPDLNEDEREEIRAVTLATLDHKAFAQVFAPGGRNEVAIVGTLPGGQLVNGRVDRLIITETEIYIIDYKTDRPAPKSSAGIGTAYVAQMAAYRAVLQQIYADHVRPVHCALLYTDGPRLIRLEPDLMSDSLNSVRSAV